MGVAIPGAGYKPSAASGAQVIDGSSRFESTKSQYLSRTPAASTYNTNTDQKKFTLSFWTKVDDYTGASWFNCGPTSGTSGNLQLYIEAGQFIVLGETGLYLASAPRFRDTGWYHFVVAVDTNQATPANRVKVYANGSEITEFTSAGYCAQNHLFLVNTNTNHEISSNRSAVGAQDYYYDGYMSQWYSIQGQTLGPENFGYTDPLTNTWRPKKYTGNYNVSEKINLSLTQNNEAIDVVVNRVVDKCWIKSDGTWLGGGNPSDVSSAPTFNLLTGEAAASLYWATTAYVNTYEVTIGTSSETGTQPVWAASSGSWSINDTVASGTFSNSYGHARTGAMTDGNVYAFTYTINADNIACNHGGWFITDEASIASYGATVPDEQTSLNSVGARWYVASYTLGYWTHVGVYNNFLDINEYSDDGSYTMLGGGGANSFYLPLDGNTPIGNDKSKPIPINRGETWSSSLASNDGFGRAGYEAYKGFNGVLTTTDYASTTNYGASKTLTFGPSPAITYHSTVEIMTRNSNVATVTFNGTTFLAVDLQWQLIANGSGTISDSNTIVIDSESSSEYATLSGIRVDGVVLIDDTYGNGWTPVNFDGSNIIDKATGALPILSTQSGGRIATVGVRTDAHAANLVLALPLVGDALDLSNQINSGSTTKTVTTTGALPRSNPDAPFYDGCYYFNGSSDYLTTPASSDFNFAGGDYTIEWWQWWNSITGYQAAFDCGYTDVDSLLVQTGSSTGKYQVYAQSDTVFEESTAAVVQKWTHYALVRNGTSIKLYRDGAVSGSGTHSGSTHGSSTHTFYVASSESGYEFNGYMQDFRVYKGVAKYTTDFIPASANPTILSDTSSGVALGSELTKLSDITTKGSVSFPNITATNEYLEIADNADWTFGSGDFTMECFAYIPTPVENKYESLAMKYTSSDPSWFWSIYSYAPSTTGAFANGTSTMNFYFYYNGGYNFSSTTPYTIRQNAWSHLAAVRDGNTVRLYVNGVQGNTIDVTGLTMDDSAVPLRVGVDGDNNYDTRASISNLRIVKGTCLYPSGTSFVPPTEPLTNVTNTKLLCCQSPTSATTAAVTPSAISATGVSASYFNPFMPDDIKTVMGQETGYATLNPLMTNGSLTDGNLTHPGSASGNSTSSIKVGSGKWYAEVTLDAAGHLGFGWTYYDQPGHPWVLDIAGYYLIYNSGTILQLLAGGNSTLTSGTGTLARLIPYQMCIDVDNNKAYIGDGVTWFNDDWNQTGSPGNPLTGENPTFTLPAGKEWYFWIYPNENAGTPSKIWANFGQKPLKYAPPEGYKLLNYANLPSPGVVRSDKVVTATKWTSTGGSSTYDVDCRLAPDLIWHKCYDGSQNNSVFTSILGPDSRLDTSGNSGEQDWHPAYFTGFTHNGYGVSSTSSDLNPAAGAKMISYCWKAGGSKGTFNKDGIVYASAADAGLDGGSATPSASSVGTKQGFSIIKVAGSNTASKTFSHGLSQAPTFAIGKLLAAAPSNSTDQDWQVYHKVGMGNTKGLQLNLSTTEETSSSLWNNTSPTDTLFSIGASTRWEGNFIMYLWHDVPGMQKFGTYNANGSDSNGPFVYLGFRPAIIMLMCYSGSGENRYIYSDKAGQWQAQPANPNYSPSFLNDNAAANTSTTGYRVDFLSDGFKLRQSNGPNTSSPASKYLYAAWAHQPMDNLYGARSNAY